MILNEKIYKIASGTNISAFSSNESEINLYIFSKQVKKYKLSCGQTLRCLFEGETFAYNYLLAFDKNFKCVCFDDNMSVIYE